MVFMQKILLLFVFLVIAGCTSNQIKSLERASGSFKVLGNFELDVTSSEPQSFVVEKPEKPSFWSARSDGQTWWGASLCFDNVDSLDEFPIILEASIAFKLTMGGKEYIADEHEGYNRSNGCWRYDERKGVYRKGWAIRGKLLPPEADFNSPMNIEIQILNDKDSVLTNLSKKYPKPILIISTDG